MIKNQAELTQTLEQLTNLYQALASQHAEIYAKNPAMFQLIAEGPTEHIRRLIRELDSYLHIAEAEEEPLAQVG